MENFIPFCIDKVQSYRSGNWHFQPCQQLCWQNTHSDVFCAILNYETQLQSLWSIEFYFIIHQFDGLMQERRNSVVNALELRLSCTNPSSLYLHWIHIGLDSLWDGIASTSLRILDELWRSELTIRHGCWETHQSHIEESPLWFLACSSLIFWVKIIRYLGM